ncbi:co-chaperone GroES [Egibacter rhizosphaerae]|uniref:Co-chaperone GroES n=1 Tax=Egibacter rhizosphaerae TaxID=1670831 RepID=A0A411YCN5_9ACTN|nr:co-chaperone GroES [Egibacter rhizosphaerae]QBI18907.1 co-chaperone GroES [Egibacter rhizosphaerae]
MDTPEPTPPDPHAAADGNASDPQEGSPDGASEPEGTHAVRVTADRLLCEPPQDSERRSKGGILIPATAQQEGRRGLWCRVVAVGPLVRGIEAEDRVLFLPDDAVEVDIRGDLFLVVRERDVHAVASAERAADPTGLYL